MPTARARRALRRRHGVHLRVRRGHRRGPRPFDDVPVWPATHYVTVRASSRSRSAIHEELRSASPALGGGQAARGTAPRDAHELRPRDARDDGLLLRHRELLAHLDGREPGRPAQLPHRLLPRRLPVHHGRVARDLPRSADARGRSQPEAHARRPRVPPAQRARQPAAALRRVRERVKQFVYVSATPGDYELGVSRSSSRSSGPTGSSTPRSSCGRRRARWTTSSARSRGAGDATSACS